MAQTIKDLDGDKLHVHGIRSGDYAGMLRLRIDEIGPDGQRRTAVFGPVDPEELQEAIHSAFLS